MNDGGPAFPALNFIVPKDLEDRHVHRLGETQGMTLRDYFAAKAMAGILAGLGSDRNPPAYAPYLSGGGEVSRDPIADTAYQYADAMLARRDA